MRIQELIDKLLNGERKLSLLLLQAKDYAENAKRNIELMLGYYRSIPEKVEKEIRTLLEVAEERLKKP